MKGKYLITIDDWFVAPDGKEYKSIWGNVEIFEDSILGIKTNRNSVNWYAKIGTESNHAIISGCQINHAIRCEERPSDRDSQHWAVNQEGKVVISSLPCKIYFAE